MTQPGNSIVDPLQRVLSNEYAAVYGYPLIGVRLTVGDQIDRARTLEAAHRAIRDAVSEQLVSQQVSPAPSAVEYLPATPLIDATTALKWAVQLEAACADGYRYLLVVATRASSPTAVRRQALAGLSDAAVNAAWWRARVTPDAPTVAFPGL